MLNIGVPSMGGSAALGLQQTGGYATLLTSTSIHNFRLYPRIRSTVPTTHQGQDPDPSRRIRVVRVCVETQGDGLGSPVVLQDRPSRRHCDGGTNLGVGCRGSFGGAFGAPAGLKDSGTVRRRR